MGPLLLPLLIVANLFGVGMIVPQVVRLRRTSVVDGVSSTWVGVSFAINGWWLGYGIEGRLWGLVPVSVGGLIVYAIVATQIRSLVGSRSLLPLLASTVAASVVLLAALASGGWRAVGLTLGLAYSLQFAPAVLNALRSPTVAGISPVTWIMAAAEAAVWIVYGLAITDRALIIGGTGGTLMASVILIRLAILEASGPRLAIPSVSEGTRASSSSTCGCRVSAPSQPMWASAAPRGRGTRSSGSASTRSRA